MSVNSIFNSSNQSSSFNLYPSPNQGVSLDPSSRLVTVCQEGNFFYLDRSPGGLNQYVPQQANVISMQVPLPQKRYVASLGPFPSANEQVFSGLSSPVSKKRSFSEFKSFSDYSIQREARIKFLANLPEILKESVQEIFNQWATLSQCFLNSGERRGPLLYGRVQSICIFPFGKSFGERIKEIFLDFSKYKEIEKETIKAVVKQSVTAAFKEVERDGYVFYSQNSFPNSLPCLVAPQITALQELIQQRLAFVIEQSFQVLSDTLACLDPDLSSSSTSSSSSAMVRVNLDMQKKQKLAEYCKSLESSAKEFKNTNSKDNFPNLKKQFATLVSLFKEKPMQEGPGKRSYKILAELEGGLPQRRVPHKMKEFLQHFASKRVTRWSSSLIFESIDNLQKFLEKPENSEAKENFEKTLDKIIQTFDSK